jgi:alpha-mannosidase
VRAFIDSALYQAAHTKGSDVLWTMGSDFQWRAANEWYTNGDKLIAAVNAEGTVEAKWSTPSIYVKAKWDETQTANLTWPLKTDDLFPYSMSDQQFWTGFFTSRPALKRYVRVASAHLQVMRQLELLLKVQGNVTERLWDALSVAQHHDGVSGTSKQHVAFDYAQRIAEASTRRRRHCTPR